jgi:cytochrome c
MERFMPEYRFSSIIDLKFGPDGSLYVLQYGSIWFNNSPDDKLLRIAYDNGENG